MAKRYTKAEFLSRLRAKIDAKEPLLQACAGSGIIAKFLERGGCDIYRRLQHGPLSHQRLGLDGWYAPGL